VIDATDATDGEALWGRLCQIADTTGRLYFRAGAAAGLAELLDALVQSGDLRRHADGSVTFTTIKSVEEDATDGGLVDDLWLRFMYDSDRPLEEFADWVRTNYPEFLPLVQGDLNEGRASQVYSIPKVVQQTARKGLVQARQDRQATAEGLAVGRILAQGGQIDLYRVRRVADYLRRTLGESATAGMLGGGRDGKDWTGRVLGKS
jgi:hypothetical protein